MNFAKKNLPCSICSSGPSRSRVLLFIISRPSVRLWHRLSLNFMHGFLSNFSCGFPWAICPDVFFFFIFKKKKIEFFTIFFTNFSFSLTCDPMEAKISKRYSFYKSQPTVFKLLLNFLPNGPHKTMFGIFEILKIEILTNFIRFR